MVLDICIFQKNSQHITKIFLRQYWIPCLVFCCPNCGPFVFATHRQKVTCWCITWDKNGGKTFNLFHILGLNMWKQKSKHLFHKIIYWIYINSLIPCICVQYGSNCHSQYTCKEPLHEALRECLKFRPQKRHLEIFLSLSTFDQIWTVYK